VVVSGAIPPLHFDRSKPFYPMVMTYVAALHGFTELLSRHLTRITVPTVPEDATGTTTGVPPAQTIGKGGEKELIAFFEVPNHRHVTALLFPLKLKSESDPQPVELDVEDIAREVFDNGAYLAPWLPTAGNMLLISSHDATKAHSNQGPLWEFFRHCRNAAAHGGRFNLLGGEPKRPASWRGLTITPALAGQPLFKGPTGGLISPGDPIRLLWDIEQSTPGL
jgi:hypothetical protein